MMDSKFSTRWIELFFIAYYLLFNMNRLVFGINSAFSKYSDLFSMVTQRSNKRMKQIIEYPLNSCKRYP